MPDVAQRKYEFTGETKNHLGRTLRQIRAVAAITSLGVEVGQIGGWIETERNLSQHGDAWVYGNARVYGDARVSVTPTFANRSDNYTFVLVPTPDGPRIIAGCRYFTFAEASMHWKSTRAGTRLGDESLAIVKHLRAMSKLNGADKKVTQEVA